MSRDPEELSGGGPRVDRPNRPGAQGAARGGVRPNSDPADDAGFGNEQYGDTYQRRQQEPPFGGYPFGGQQRRQSGWKSFFTGGPRFLGLPVNLVYTLGALLIGVVFFSAVCGRPTAAGVVAGQVMGLNADRSLTPLAGAQVALRGSGQTYTAVTTEVPADAQGEAAYNYRLENIPPGDYVLSVTPPPGAAFQPEENIPFEVKSGQLFPQSVMLLAQGMQKPRALAENELQPGEAGGYVNERGERVVYRQGSGFDASDALLMYLLWRNPPMWGYGAPPVVYTPSGTSSSSYRVADPPSSSRSGQTVTQQRPSTPGQGSTRPSGSTGVTGSGPNTSTKPSDAVAPAQTKPSTGTGNSGANTSTQTKPSTSTGGSQTTTRPSLPSQGTTRPSSSTTSPSRSSAPSRSSGSSGGGRR